jgi:hypothetical protein
VERLGELMAAVREKEGDRWSDRLAFELVLKS